jgi:membrane-anchored protein YejM (alkaline phosphatase superfamily)
MKKNMGYTDRIIRVIIAVIFAGLYFSGSILGTFGIVLFALSIVLIATSLIGSCPLYLPFGISTLQKKVVEK